MKAIIILGSRNPEGQTASAADALAQGIVAAGGEVSRVFLTERSIERCRQCESNGWGLCRSEGRCIIEDDLAGIVDQIRGADVAVLATPVYFGDLCESLRAFLDRLRRICRHDAGKTGIAGKPAVGICVAGGGGGGAPNCCLSLERVLATTGFAVVDVVPVRRQNREMKRQVLQVVGRWLAKADALQ
ncbi:MAG: flavodoxin family protein [Chloroflexi bacterium]|nr:flavodoxin family protein [Chloroflexota bacterium]